MQVLLEEHELLECIGTEAGDVEEFKEQQGDTAQVKQDKKNKLEKWLKKQRKCKSMLISRIHDSMLEYVQDKQTPKMVWDALKQVFERHSIASRMHLKRQMLSLRFDGGSLQEHFLRFDRLVRDYRGTGAAMEELDVVCHLLLTLGPSFSTVVTALETMPEQNLKMEFVKCRLLDEEIKQKGIDVEPCTSKSDQAAFWGTKQVKKKSFKCFGCKQEGHKLSDCPTKKKNEKQKPNPNAHVAEQNGVCFAGVTEPKCDEKVMLEWYIDSGCSDHLVNDRSLFDDLKRLKCPVEIAIAKDGESVLAEHAGTVKVLSRVGGSFVECTVKNVLYVPDLRCNLFSVMRVDEAGMRVIYEDGEVKIYSGTKLVATGARSGKLYRLDLFRSKCGANSSMLSCGRIPKNLELWHRRYGHLNARSLQKLLCGELVSGMKLPGSNQDKSVIVCEPCVIGKQTRKPFAVREERRSSRVLELIHSDVCGPVSPVGVHGEKYFVTFVDDWSHFTMVFLIQSKDEVFECFEQYEALVTSKFNHKICRLRCDNGGEYKSRNFESFCKKKGIRVEWTVPYTPEQNGVSERMNRTLVEKVRSMLEDCKADRRFWGQAIQTAAYLINRSPSNALESDVTPYQLWEGRKPDVSKLRAFGCSVFVHVPKELRKKLDGKSWKGMFVGYTHNGYRVWDPRFRKIVHVRDVDFIEAERFKVEAKRKAGSEAFFRPIFHEENDVVPDEPDEEESDDSDDTSDEFDSFSEEENQSEEQEHPSVNERPIRDRNAPGWHRDYEMNCSAYAFNATSLKSKSE